MVLLDQQLALPDQQLVLPIATTEADLGGYDLDGVPPGDIGTGILTVLLTRALRRE